MKKRTSRGSGTKVDDVNKLINQFNKMKEQWIRLAECRENGNLNEESLEKMMNQAQAQLKKQSHTEKRFK